MNKQKKRRTRSYIQKARINVKKAYIKEDKKKGGDW
jgi:hypothetical protein